MKTFLSRNTLLILCALAVSTARAATITSTYIGPIEGNWGDPANWSPPVVPNNGGGDTFAVRIANVFLTLDLDVAVNRITFAPGDSVIFGGAASLLLCIDHDFSSLRTKVGTGASPISLPIRRT